MTTSSGCIIINICGLLLLSRFRPDSVGEMISLRNARAAASSFASGYSPSGAIDSDRFSSEMTHAWQGSPGQSTWWWQVEFDQVREVGALLQTMGDHPFVMRNAPVSYAWQSSADGQTWRNLDDASLAQETRRYRIHRLRQPVPARYLRLQVTAATGAAPTLCEVEFYSDPAEVIVFPDWIVAVNTTHDTRLPGHGQEFIPLARASAGWNELQAQQVWLGEFNEEFVRAEPRPLCAFLSGNFKDWCEVSRAAWRGTQEVLTSGHLPMWASCGGAQGLAILAETGVDQPWDCPHCRDPNSPRTPIYTHIGHTGRRACGDYSECVFERGPHAIKQSTRDPAFAGLEETFTAMESHCGQIEWAPKGWRLIATSGPGTLTKTQCLRLDGHYVYAAQFHIEMEGTPEVSRRIMSNFLGLAKAWGGWNLQGRADR